MTRKSPLLLSILALLPMLATTAEAGRRTLTARKSTTAPARVTVRQSLFDFSSWVTAVNAQIALSRESGPAAKVRPSAVPGRTIPESLPPKAAATSLSTPPPATGPAEVAAAALAQAPPGPRRIKEGNPVVILLIPKPVISSF